MSNSLSHYISIIFFWTTFLGACGCAQKPSNHNSGNVAVQSQQPDLPSPNNVIHLGVGGAGLKFGMSREEVIKILGDPEKTYGPGGSVLQYPSRGLALTVFKTRGLARITYTSRLGTRGESSDSPYRTQDRIGIGSSRNDVLRALGPPNSEITNDSQTTLEYKSFQATVILLNDTVIQLESFK